MSNIKEIANKIHNGINYFDGYTPIVYKIPTGCYDSREIKKLLQMIDATTKEITTNIYKDGIHAYNIDIYLIKQFDKNKLDEIIYETKNKL